MNSANYQIDGKNIINAELSESFSGKFIEETEKILRQWKTQMSEGSFNKFVCYYVDYVGICIERLLILKNFSTYGVILLEKVKKAINLIIGCEQDCKFFPDKGNYFN